MPMPLSRIASRLRPLSALAVLPFKSLEPEPADPSQPDPEPVPNDTSTETPGELILPHPRMQDRAFVLGPLADVAPAWRHPVTGRTVAEMWKALAPEARAGTEPLAPVAPRLANLAPPR